MLWSIICVLLVVGCSDSDDAGLVDVVVRLEPLGILLAWVYGCR
jgi:hypothetical protein